MRQPLLLYGSRAANGVILITTKKGTVGRAKVTFKRMEAFLMQLSIPSDIEWGTAS